MWPYLGATLPRCGGLRAKIWPLCLAEGGREEEGNKKLLPRAEQKAGFSIVRCFRDSAPGLPLFFYLHSGDAFKDLRAQSA